jgi:hypothetical protein
LLIPGISSDSPVHLGTFTRTRFPVAGSASAESGGGRCFEAALAKVMQYSLPGNLRELIYVIAGAVILVQGEPFSPSI